MSSSFDPNVHEAGEPRMSQRQSLSTQSSGVEADLEVFEAAFVKRKTVPLLRRTSVGAGESPESILTRTTVSITGIVARGSHIEFAIEVDTGVETHVVHKRYSEIRGFRKKLLCEKSTPACNGACTQLSQLAEAKFPRRRIAFPGCGPSRLSGAGQRMQPLESFLQSLLLIFRTTTRRQMRMCVSGNCAMVALIRGFFEVDELASGDEGDQDDHAEATERDLLAALQELEEEKAQPVEPVTLVSDKLATISKQRGSLYAISEDLDPTAAH